MLVFFVVFRQNQNQGFSRNYSLTLNFDAEVDLFDYLSSLISQNDDLDGPIELEVMKHEKTLIIYYTQYVY